MPTIIKPIRSFVRRERRSIQQTFPKALWEEYGISIENTNKLESFLECFNHLTLEIGFGTGDTLFEQAKERSEQGYLGIEVYKTGIKNLLLKVKEASLNNIRVLEGDAVQLLANDRLYNRFDAIQILFPDPWPKRRHHKRRLIQPEFLKLLQQLLKPGGLLYLATDCEHYAHHMLTCLKASSFVNEAESNAFSKKPSIIPLTKFEARGHQLGHGAWYLIFKKCL